MKVSFYKTREAKAGTSVDITDIFTRIKSGDWFENIKEYIEGVVEKDTLPCFTPAGEFSNSKKKADIKELSGYIHADIDDIADLKESRESIERILLGMNGYRCSFVSPSRTGLKVFFECVGLTIENYENFTKHLNTLLSKKLSGIKCNVDIQCANINRLCYVSYDECLEMSYDTEYFVLTEEVVKTYNDAESSVGYELKDSDASHRLIGMFDYLRKTYTKFPSDERKMLTFRLSAWANASGILKENVYEFLKQYVDESYLKIISRTYKQYINQFGILCNNNNTDLSIQELADLALRDKKNIGYITALCRKLGIYKRIINNTVVTIVIKDIDGYIDQYSGMAISACLKDYLKVKLNNIEVADIIGNKIIREKDIIDTIDDSKILSLGNAEDSYLFFKNKIIRINKKGEVAEIDPAQLSGYVWKNNRINKDFNYTDEIGVFEQFTKKVAGDKQKVLNQIEMYIYGYVGSGCDNPANRRCVLLTDYTADDGDRSPGGSGKSIIATSLQNLRSTAIYDGKTFDAMSTFAYSLNDESTNVVIIDDMKKNADVESFNSIITNGMVLNKKHQQQLRIDASQYKIVMTSNTLLRGVAASDLRRLYLIDVSCSMYNLKFTPFDDFGMMLFADFDDAEWNRYYSYMIRCIAKYMRAKNTITSDVIEINDDKVIASNVPEEFITLVNGLERGTAYKMTELANIYSTTYSRKPPSFNALAKWLKVIKDYSKELEVVRTHTREGVVYKIEQRDKEQQIELEF